MLGGSSGSRLSYSDMKRVVDRKIVVVGDGACGKASETREKYARSV